jgi:hypothetical protein
VAGVSGRDEESGRFTEQYTDEQFLDALRDADGGVGTSDVADAVGAEYDVTYTRLRELEERGAVASRKVANARLWSVAEGSASQIDERPG